MANWTKWGEKRHVLFYSSSCICGHCSNKHSSFWFSHLKHGKLPFEVEEWQVQGIKWSDGQARKFPLPSPKLWSSWLETQPKLVWKHLWDCSTSHVVNQKCKLLLSVDPEKLHGMAQQVWSVSYLTNQVETLTCKFKKKKKMPKRAYFWFSCFHLCGSVSSSGLNIDFYFPNWFPPIC